MCVSQSSESSESSESESSECELLQCVFKPNDVHRAAMVFDRGVSFIPDAPSFSMQHVTHHISPTPQTISDFGPSSPTDASVPHESMEEWISLIHLNELFAAGNTNIYRSILRECERQSSDCEILGIEYGDASGVTWQALPTSDVELRALYNAATQYKIRLYYKTAMHACVRNLYERLLHLERHML